MNEGKLIGSTQKHEGCRLTAYQDTRGVWTIGWGRNLQTLRISAQQAAEWHNEDLSTAIAEAKGFPEYACLDTDARQNAFIEMVFNMGPRKVLGFTNMLAAIRLQHFADAAKHALDSDWAKQVGKRAVTLSEMLRTGEFPQS